MSPPVRLLLGPQQIAGLELVGVGTEQKRQRPVDDRLTLHRRRNRPHDQLLLIVAIFVDVLAVAHPVFADRVRLHDPVALCLRRRRARQEAPVSPATCGPR